MALSDEEIIMKHVVPSLGLLLAHIMWLAPLKSVLNARRTGSLDGLNVIPMVLMFACTISWIGYSYVQKNYYLYFSNEVGLLLGTFYCFTCIPLASKKVQDMAVLLFLLSLLTVSLMGFVSVMAITDHALLRKMWGILGDVTACLYFFAPLTSIGTVLRNRDSSSMHWATCLANTTNTGFWVIYAVAIQDIWVAIPNIIGVMLAAVSLLLCCVFPRKAATEKASKDKRQDTAQPIQI